MTTPPWTPPGETPPEPEFPPPAPPMPPPTYPSPQAFAFGHRGCATAFRPYVGIAYGRSKLDFWIYYPTEKSWTLLHDHSVTCVVGAPDRKTSGTLKGARR